MIEENESNIRKTRMGFHFQDTYALYLFLGFILDETMMIKEFYVDYPVFKLNSIDIKLIFENQGVDEHIYEIKSGLSWIDKWKNEMRKELLFFYDYTNKAGHRVIHMSLLTANYCPAKWRELWDKLKLIKENESLARKDDLSKLKNYYYNEFGFKERGITLEDFVSFITKFNFDKVELDIQGLERNIIGSISRLASSKHFIDQGLRVDKKPDFDFMRIKLMNVIQNNVGLKNNLVPLLIEEMSKYFSECYSGNVEQVEINKNKDSYKSILEEMIYGSSKPQLKPAPNIPEGAEIKKRYDR